ncbi:MAG: T9SS type A sorting domain-containing protein [Bacteroidales bacterium]|nr:T9SS type A sorting domain-containing protein [Bacteroidales bacterium]
MKKFLLFSLLVVFSSATFAQSAMMSQKERLQKVTMQKQEAVKDASTFTDAVVNTYVANDRGADVVIGNTVYDLQSNATMQHRTYTFPDGTRNAVWTMGFNPTSYPERGTGYNYFDGTSWGPVPTERIEAERVGWPAVAPYGETGEIVCVHTSADGLLFSWRPVKGEGAWSTFTLYGPAGTGGLTWPRMITSGENNEVVHVIATLFDEAFDDQDAPIYYSRTSDGGVTWDPENVVLDGIGPDYSPGYGGDEYCWAAPMGETIAFVAFGGFTDGTVMKSTDNGTNWERFPFYLSPEPFFDGTQVLPRFGGGDSYNAAVIDETGKVHVAFGRMLHASDGSGTTSYYPYTDGLIYWNEDMPPLDSAMIGSDVFDLDYLEANGYLLARVQENGEDTIVGVATYQASLTSMPQLVYKDGFVYAQYSAVSLGFDNSEFNYRHIWGTVTEGDGIWAQAMDYTGDVFHIFSECVFPSSSPTADLAIHTVYQTSNMPGIAERYAGHDPIDNNIVDLAIPLHVGVNELNTTAFEVSQNTPNPAIDNTVILVNTQKIGTIKLAVSNVLGQVVYTASDAGRTLGAHAFTLNVSDLETGLYFYTVSVGNQSVTKKMLVK